MQPDVMIGVMEDKQISQAIRCAGWVEDQQVIQANMQVVEVKQVSQVTRCSG